MTQSNNQHALEILAQRITPGSRLLRVWSLQGGISAGMTAFELQTPDGETRKMILRQPGTATLRRSPHAAENEFRLLQILHTQQLAVPAPVFLDSTGEILPEPYLVIEYIQGEPDFAPTNRIDFICQLAENLARIHTLNLRAHDVTFLHPQEGCPELTRSQTAGSRSELEIAPVMQAIQSASQQPNRSVLLHGDYWPGNILWDAGRLAAVIDWEDAIWGDPLSDLAISRLDIAWIIGMDAMHSFTQHYLSLMTLDDTNLPYWDLCAALRLARLVGDDLAGWARYFQPYGRGDITENTISSCYRVFVDQALQKVSGR